MKLVILINININEKGIGPTALQKEIKTLLAIELNWAIIVILIVIIVVKNLKNSIKT